MTRRRRWNPGEKLKHEWPGLPQNVHQTILLGIFDFHTLESVTMVKSGAKPTLEPWQCAMHGMPMHAELPLVLKHGNAKFAQS
jgi:hypothetical protein